MRTVLMRSIAVVCMVGAAGFLQAQEFSKLSDAERQQVNEWMAERAERMIVAYNLETELSKAWMIPAYTSPAIEAARKRYQELQDETARAHADLKRKVLELPALQEKQKQLEQEKERVANLSRQVKEKTGEGQRPAPAPKRIETRESTNGETKEQ